MGDCAVSLTCEFIAKIIRQERSPAAASTDGWASSERGCCREGRARVTFMAFGGDIRYGRRSLLLSPRTELVVKPEMIGLDLGSG